MNPEEKKLLQEIHELSEENSKILHGMRRSNRWSTIFRIFYWIIIIGVSLGAFYYIQPYINTVLKAYQGIQKDLNNVKTITDKIPSLGQ